MRKILRPMRVLVLVLLAIVGLWFALPSVASMVIEQWLERQGYHEVLVELGRPGLRTMTVPKLTLSRRLTGEVVTLSMEGGRAQYTLLGLWAGHLDLIALPDLSIEIRTVQEGLEGAQLTGEGIASGVRDTSFNVVTASDLVQGLPLLPCDELHLGRVKIFREQATGPLQTLVMTGTVKKQSGQLVVEMLLQGTDTSPYELLMTGQSASDMSLQLRAARAEAPPIVLWRSESDRNESYVQLKGVVEVDIQELAPFLTLVLPVESEWRQAAGNVMVHWTGKAASDVPVDALWKDARTEVQASVHVNVALPELSGLGEDLTVKVAGTLSGNATLVYWAIAPGTLVTAMVDARKVQLLTPLHELIPPGFQPMAIKGVQEVKGALHWTESPPRFTAMGPLAVSYGSAKGPAYVEMVAAQLVGHGLEIDRLEGNFRVKGHLPRSMSESVGIKRGSGDIRGTMLLRQGDLRATILPPSAATAARFLQGPVAVDGGTVQLLEPLPVQLDVVTGRWVAGPGLFSLRLPQVLLAERQVTMRQATVKLEKIESTDAAWSAEATAHLQGVALMFSANRSLPVDLTVRMTTDPDVVKGDVHVESQEKAVKFAVELEHAWATGRGTARGTLAPLTFDRTGFRLRQLLSPWSYPIDVTSGRVAATIQAAWAEDAQHHVQVRTGSAEVTVEQLGAQYHGITLTGLNTKVNVMAQGREKILTSRPVEVRAASVDSGVEMTNVVMSAQGEWDLRETLPVVEVRNLSLELLGARVTSQGVRADLAHPPFSFTMLVRQLDLQQVLSLEQQQGLRGTGLLDGTIPVVLTSRGVMVTDGQLEARPPGGKIQYVASPEATKAVTQSNANMQLVLQALNNFHYNVLEIGVQYVEDGTLNLKVRIEGRNPDQKKSPPIHLNLTVQENVPALLKSLRLVQDIEESVQKRFIKP